MEQKFWVDIIIDFDQNFHPWSGEFEKKNVVKCQMQQCSMEIILLKVTV